MPGLLGDYNWQSMKVQDALNKIYSEFDTLAIIRKTPKLIVFSENFFGRKIVRQKQEFEELLKQHTSRFEDTIFAINYLCTEQTDVHVFEIKRTIKKMQKYEKIKDDISTIIQFNQFEMTWYEKLLTLNSVIQKYCAMYANCIEYNTRILHHAVLCNFESAVNNCSCIKYLCDIVKSSKKNAYNVYTLENKTLYIFNKSTIMTYNKTTYCDEVEDLRIDCSNDYYVYLFGHAMDILHSNSNLALCMHKNISTEICKDLSSNVRRHVSSFKRIHIVQSDWINVKMYEANLPECNIVINADTHYTNVYKKHNLKLQQYENFFCHCLKLQQFSCSLDVFLLA